MEGVEPASFTCIISGKACWSKVSHFRLVFNKRGKIDDVAIRSFSMFSVRYLQCFKLYQDQYYVSFVKL